MTVNQALAYRKVLLKYDIKSMEFTTKQHYSIINTTAIIVSLANTLTGLTSHSFYYFY